MYKRQGLYINSSTDGQLDLVADTEIQIAATTVDLNGILDVSGKLVAGGQISAADGSAAAPALSNTGDLATGFYFSAAGKVSYSSAGTGQITFQNGAILPVSDNDIDLGTSSYEFRHIYVDGTTNLDEVDIDGAVQIDGTVTVGVDDTGLDVKFFGAAAGAYGLYDQSENAFEVRGATAAGAGLLKLTTGELTVVDADKLGRIDFQAPLESDGTDAVAIAASIWAEADDTFSSSVNNTDLVFALGKSEAAAEKFRLTADGEIGLGGANYGTDGQVLTSAGAGAAAAWEDASSGVAGKVEGTNFTDSLLVGHSTTGTLDAAIKNTGVGIDALNGLTQGDHNTGVGFDAGGGVTSGTLNTFVGSYAGSSTTTGGANTGIGYTALNANTGDANTAVGILAGYRNASGTYNTSLGHSALEGVASNNHSYNTAIGGKSNEVVTTGGYNVTLGYQSGDNLTTGSGNIIIGTGDAAAADSARTLKIVSYDGSSTTNHMLSDSSGNVIHAGTTHSAGGQLTTTGKALVMGF